MKGVGESASLQAVRFVVDLRGCGDVGDEGYEFGGAEYRAGFAFYEGFPSQWGLLDGSAGVSGRVRRVGECYHLDVTVEYMIRTECSRCLVELEYRRRVESELMLVEGEGDEYEDEGVRAIGADADEYDLYPYVRETVLLDLPMRIHHGMEGVAEGACNPKMLSYFVSDSEIVSEEDELSYRVGDTPFGALLRDALRE